MVTEARKCGVKSVVVPFENREEAASVSGITICPLKTLPDTIRFLEGRLDLTKQLADEDREMQAERNAELLVSEPQMGEQRLDFSDVRGQDDLIEAIVLGAAGGHNILMIGEPGCGKTMIAQRIPTILPTMSEKESLEVTKIHSIAGLMEAGDGLIHERPFRAPHHNVSLNALIGGGSYAQPGEVSLAHNGVLFLDEIAEFSRGTLDSM
jgi:magnesium chelatase family protein